MRIKGISISRFLPIATCVYSASGHDDLEGFCAAVLPAYQKYLNEIEFVGCECEESHSGKEQTLVVCTFIKDIASKTTASCNAKFCLFTQQCEEPDNFAALELSGNAFDLSSFEEWCVEENADLKETTYPSRSPTKDIKLDENTTIMPSNPQIQVATSNACRRYLLKLSSCGTVILATTLLLMHTIL
eukprot:scaffold4054_cov142-Skeletonema_menzelii.AAC.29